MNFELACLEDFNEIENLYWDLIDKSKEEPSFPDWKKGVHPSADFLMAGIVQKELFVLRDEGIIKACAIVNSNSNKEYKRVAWMEAQVCDGYGYTLQITYKDGRKRVIEGDIGGGTIDGIMGNYLKKIFGRNYDD